MPEQVEKEAEELRRVPEWYALGLLKAVLPRFRIDPAAVRRVLRLILALGHDPVKLYRRVLEDRPEDWEKPPLLGMVLPRRQPRRVSSLLEAREELEETTSRILSPKRESPT